MSLKSVCVDRGRAVYDVEDPEQPWIEGEPFGEQALGPWFRCRLTVQEPTEITQVPGVRGPASRGYRHLEAAATLLLTTLFEDGSSLSNGPPGVGRFIAFQDGQMVLIESQATMADELWHVHSGVQPIRKKRKVIGYTVGLRRAREPTVVTGRLGDEATTVVPPPLVGGARRVEALAALEEGEE